MSVQRVVVFVIGIVLGLGLSLGFDYKAALTVLHNGHHYTVCWKNDGDHSSCADDDVDVEELVDEGFQVDEPSSECLDTTDTGSCGEEKE